METTNSGLGKRACTVLDGWPQRLHLSEKRIHSQLGQDGVLNELFHQLGTTNKYYVEFGFNSDRFDGGSGANTYNLYLQGWEGLLLDGGNENPSINLHREYLSTDNIVELFKKYNVPSEPDYVSIDVDSCDIWLFLEITKVYHPRVVTIEFNPNFPPGSTFAWPMTCGESWHGDRFMGSSLGAIFEAARDSKYIVVHALDFEAFLVREDLIECPLQVLPQWMIENRVAGKPVHPPGQNMTRFQEFFVDYVAFRETHNEAAAKGRAAKLLPFAPLVYEGAPSG